MSFRESSSEIAAVWACVWIDLNMRWEAKLQPELRLTTSSTTASESPHLCANTAAS